MLGFSATWQPLAQLVDRRCDLRLCYFLVLVLLVVSLQSLPWQAPLQKVHQHVTDRLQVVSSALLDAQVRVHASVPCCPSQALPLPVRNVQVLLGNSVLVLGSRYFLASPKSIMYTRSAFLLSPIRKLSGLMSR